MIILRTILNDLVAFIRSFEDSLKEKYSIDVNPYLEKGYLGKIPRIGHVDEYEYHYHGGGCTVRYRGIRCEYGIYPNRGKEIIFTLWGLTEFLKTNSKYADYIINEEALKAEIESMVETGELLMDEIDGRKFENYLINWGYLKIT
jgi:hypothetical protein